MGYGDIRRALDREPLAVGHLSVGLTIHGGKRKA
jgi:hypothetical protein